MEPMGLDPPDNGYSSPAYDEEPVTDNALDAPRYLLTKGKNIASCLVDVLLLQWITHYAP